MHGPVAHKVTHPKTSRMNWTARDILDSDSRAGGYSGNVVGIFSQQEASQRQLEAPLLNVGPRPKADSEPLMPKAAIESIGMMGTQSIRRRTKSYPRGRYSALT